MKLYLSYFLWSFFSGQPVVEISEKKDEVLNKAVEIVISFESFENKPYRCSSDVLTIGHGICYYPDGSKVKIGDSITEQRSKKLVKEILQKNYKYLKRYLPSLKPNQMVSLLSFSYNIGIHGLIKSKFVRVIKNKGDLKEIELSFKRYVYSAGVECKGLKCRRNKEWQIFTDNYLIMLT